MALNRSKGHAGISRRLAAGGQMLLAMALLAAGRPAVAEESWWDELLDVAGDECIVTDVDAFGHRKACRTDEFIRVFDCSGQLCRVAYEVRHSWNLGGVQTPPPPPIPWTTVGSAGTVDDYDLDNVYLSSNYVKRKPASVTSRNTSYVRYNITAVGDLADPEVEFYDVKVMGLDTEGGFNDGDKAKLDVMIRESTPPSSAGAVLFRFETNGDEYPRTNGQFRGATLECVRLPFDWTTSQYYLDVRMTTNDDSASVAFYGVSVGRAQRTCP